MCLCMYTTSWTCSGRCRCIIDERRQTTFVYPSRPMKWYSRFMHRQVRLLLLRSSAKDEHLSCELSDFFLHILTSTLVSAKMYICLHYSEITRYYFRKTKEFIMSSRGIRNVLIVMSIILTIEALPDTTHEQRPVSGLSESR